MLLLLLLLQLLLPESPVKNAVALEDPVVLAADVYEALILLAVAVVAS